MRIIKRKVLANGTFEFHFWVVWLVWLKYSILAEFRMKNSKGKCKFKPKENSNSINWTICPASCSRGLRKSFLTRVNLSSNFINWFLLWDIVQYFYVCIFILLITESQVSHWERNRMDMDRAININTQICRTSFAVEYKDQHQRRYQNWFHRWFPWIFKLKNMRAIESETILWWQTARNHDYSEILKIK